MLEKHQLSAAKIQLLSRNWFASALITALPWLHHNRGRLYGMHYFGRWRFNRFYNDRGWRFNRFHHNRGRRINRMDHTRRWLNYHRWRRTGRLHHDRGRRINRMDYYRPRTRRNNATDDKDK